MFTVKELLRSNARGGGQAGLVFVLIILLIAGYLGSQLLPIYINLTDIEGQMEGQAAKAKVFTDEKIRKYLMEQIDELGIELESGNDLKILRRSSTMIIDLYYEEVLAIDFGEDYYWELYVFELNPRVEEEF